MAVLNFGAFAQSLPYATRILTLLLLAFSLALALLRLFLTEGVHVVPFPRHDDTATEFPYLVIVPGASLWTPWTLVTAAFCETTVLEFIISLTALTLGGRYLERIWGATELLRFSAIVVVVSNAIAWFLAVALYLVVGGETGMYRTQYHGLEALQTGFLVAFAQLIPEHQLQFKFGIKIRVRDLPMAYVTFSNVACLLGYLSPYILIQFGWLSSWAYLRFFKQNDSGVRGDRSEAFSFVSWFPPFLHKPVSFISSFLYKIFLRLGIVQPWSYSAMGDVELGVGSGLPSMSVGIGGAGQQGSFGQHGVTGSGAPYTTRAEAERRRAMALKALDQRVKAGGGGINGTPAHYGPTGSGTYPPASAAPTRPAVAASAVPPPSSSSAGAPNGRGVRRTSLASAQSGAMPSSIVTNAESLNGLAPAGSRDVPRVIVEPASEDASPVIERSQSNGGTAGSPGQAAPSATTAASPGTKAAS